MAGKRTVWDLSLEIAGKDKGASEAVRKITKAINDSKKAMADAKKAWGDFGKSAGKLALGVAAGVAAAGAGVLKLAGDFAAVGNQVAKTSDALGMSIEGYQKLKFAMTDSGLGAEEFDGALQKMSNTIKLGAAGNKKAAGQLEAIGLSAEKLNKMRPEEAFERISDYMATLPSDAKRTEMAIQLFGKTAGPKMAAAMKMGSKGIQALGKEAQGLGIIMSTEQARASEEYSNQLSRMKLSITGVKNQFIGGAIGPITEAFKTLTGAVKDQMPNIQELGAKFGAWLGEAVKKLPEIIAKIKEIGETIWGTITKIKDFVGGWKNLALAVGILLSLKTAILGIKAVMATIIAVKKAWVVVQTVLNAVLNANPIALIVIGVAALIAGIILLVKNWDKVVAALKKAFEAIGNFFKKIWEGIKSFFAKVVGFVKKNALNIANVLVAILFFPAGVVMAAVRLIIKHWDKIKEFFINLWNSVKEIFSKAWEGIKNVFGKVGEFFSGVWGKAKEVAGKAWDGMKNVAGKAWEGIKGGEAKAGSFLKNNWKTIAVGMVNPMAGGLKALYDHNEKFRNFVDNTWGKIKNIAGKVWDKMPDGVKNVFIKIKDIISGAIEKIKSILSGIKNFFAGLWGAIKQGPSAVFEYLKNAFFGLIDKIKEKFIGFLNIFKQGWSAFKDVAGKAWEGIKGTAGKAWEGIKGGAAKAWDGMKNVANKAWDGIKNVAGKAGGFLKNNWKSIAVGMVSPMAGGLSALYKKHEGFRNLVDGVWGKIKDTAGKAWGGVKNIAGQTFDNMKQSWSMFKDVAGRAWDGIKGAASTAWGGMKTAASATGDFFKNVWGKTRDGAVAAWNAVINFFKSIPDRIKQIFSKVTEIFKSIFGENITNIVSNLFNQVKNIASDFFGIFKALFSGNFDKVKEIIGGLGEKFASVFNTIKELVMAVVNFIFGKFKAVGDFISGIGDKIKGIAGGIGDKIKGGFNAVKNKITGHAEGGIFKQRHVAEIAEKGAEAVVPLNKSPQGFDIWKQAGELGGYLQKASAQAAQKAQPAISGSTEAQPAAIAAAKQKATGGENIVNIDFKMTNNFNGTPDANTAKQISEAGQKAGDDFEAKVRAVFNAIARENRRISYAY